MEKLNDYRGHARECRRLATLTSREDHRAALIQMAETWEQLAIEREPKVKADEPTLSADGLSAESNN
ncbi:hypothetical protein [Salinarimonas soli]|uniref:Uncharacterized protein n=1 Tax=Salinarimonas soli TaxID=1638099 RepID=A0A5B2VS15_9HYPH|nr:hypothetical protein [Salinarimonas soli]KAA2241136.1 hypothetical protein F0L46_04885 [Salinarimonas soli]